MKAFSSLSFFLVFMYVAALAQGSDAVVMGHVQNRKNKKPVANTARISVYGTDGCSFEVSSDAHGNYVITRHQLTEGASYVVSCGGIDGTGKRCLNTTGKFTVHDGFPSTPIILNFDLTCGPTCSGLGPANIYFQLHNYELDSVARLRLDDFVITLLDNPTITIEIQGHADASEHEPFTLSQKRASAVMRYLVTKHIEAGRIKTRALGDTAYRVLEYDTGPFIEGDTLSPAYIEKLVMPEDIELARKLNAYTGFKVLRTDYVPKK